jgi:hypothetical protein
MAFPWSELTPQRGSYGPGATGGSNGSSGRHRDLEPLRLLKPMSIERSKAGCARFLTLIHSRRRPER